MPKLTNRPAKYSKLKQYAVIYIYGKIHYLGLYGSEEFRVEHELAKSSTVNDLREVKALSKGTPDTFDHKKRRAVSDDVIIATLPFLPPTL
jgi:hypothetical protein